MQAMCSKRSVFADVLQLSSQHSLSGAGSLKITPSIAWSTSMLAWGMLTFGEGYNRSNAWETGRDTLKWNTDYLLKTFMTDADGSATSEAPEFYIVYQVCYCCHAC